GWVMALVSTFNVRVWLWPVASRLVWSKYHKGLPVPVLLVRIPGMLLLKAGRPQPCWLSTLWVLKSYCEPTVRAPLIKRAFNRAGLGLPKPRRLVKNSSINAASPLTAAADMLVPLSYR